ncbi:TetR/AcrR family transcriptional regulator [Aurantimonas sp. VKM B-3413]|uniref:TetR/AcrR family transcriptional regulator n=1 Tax=Aurantimonas sp. VKM B-3413 TaxID=2779401 RepID=UPI001E5654F8|nr:TetR/AcrR family transcriptional regulator [Aurantimonas sp. VKM B-3413]MCB8837546.1 TetR/AcrR family transcriptional regulator [Aurantimonas sp. VKM B-3413]
MPRIARDRSEAISGLAEVFREHGYEGASLARITEATGLGKGSLYHFFPGGKEEMAEAVLDEIAAWFAREIFSPLRDASDPGEAIARMLDGVETYFHSGRRVCLIGSFALGCVRDRFADRVAGYFGAWRAALAAALRREGVAPSESEALAEDAIAAIQGGLVAARALDDPALFSRTIDRLRQRLRT